MSAFGAGATTDESLAFAEELGVTVLPLELQEVSPTADVTGQLQNLLINGANVIYVQSLSFGPAQVIGTLQAIGAWNQVVTGGVNWSINTDVAAAGFTYWRTRPAGRSTPRSCRRPTAQSTRS